MYSHISLRVYISMIYIRGPTKCYIINNNNYVWLWTYSDGLLLLSLDIILNLATQKCKSDDILHSLKKPAS